MITQTVADQIIEVIEYLGQKFGIAIDWSAENLVPIAEHLGGRIIDWKIASSICWIGVCAIVIIAGVAVAIKAYKHCEGYGGMETLTIISAVVSGCFSIGIFVNCFELVKCLTFPELAILEYIQSFIQ